MDVLSLLLDRTRLIRKFYELATPQLNEIRRKIKAGVEPYASLYTDDGEPPFLDEWVDASELLEVAGRTCVSMLSGSLQLYFMTWERELGITCGEGFAAAFKKNGLIPGYKACLSERVGIDWNDCPADLAIIEQVVLARNRDQHPEDITTIRVSHTLHDLKRYPQPFFLNEHEAKLFQAGEAPSFFMLPSIYVSRGTLMTAIEQVECLCRWLEKKLFDAKWR